MEWETYFVLKESRRYLVITISDVLVITNVIKMKLSHDPDSILPKVIMCFSEILTRFDL